jgi:MFS family permease
MSNTQTKTRRQSNDRAAGNTRSNNKNWHTLAVVLVGSFMAVLDTTIVNVALPSIGQGLRASSASLEWVVSGYALSFGLSLVLAGRLGDRYGPKPFFIGGLLLFTLASVGCGVSRSSSELIVGFGAGIFYPAISATLQRTFTGDDRSRAFAYFGAVVGISTAAGPLLGGALIDLGGEQSGWRWVFLVNPFVGAAIIPVAWRVLHSDREDNHHKLDPVGNALLAVVLLLLLIPLVEGRAAGWPLWSVLVLVAALPGAVILGFWEVRLFHREGEPVLRPTCCGTDHSPEGRYWPCAISRASPVSSSSSQSSGRRGWAEAPLRPGSWSSPSRSAVS